MSHTPGRWKASAPSGPPPILPMVHWVSDAEHGTLAWVPVWSNIPAHQAEANARLIAAAPDLLAACQAMLDAHTPIREATDMLREAVRRATRGESADDQIERETAPLAAPTAPPEVQ